MVVVFAKIFVLLFVLFLYGILPSTQAERHSLYYIYTGLSKPVDLPGIYEFSAMGLLDDTQIDYYDSKLKRKIPTQYWMKEKMQEDYWEKGTQTRKSKEQWFNVNVHIMMNRMRDDESDLHVLQWRTGCEIRQQGNELHFLKGIYEFSYDGENFLAFDDKESQWVAPVDEALPTKRKWDNIPIINQYTKGYLEKECVSWLNQFRKYRDEELRNYYYPDVYIFAKRSISDKTRLKITCMVTGFYHKDLMLNIRKYNTSLPEDEIESTGIRPNQDGSFQMMKSLEIKEEEKAEYDCFVFHSSLKEPIITKWAGKCRDFSPETYSVLIGAVIMLAVAAVGVYIVKKKKIIGFKSRNEHEPNYTSAEVPLKKERHSLYYIYTALSKPMDQPGIYEFSAMGLLDGTQIDYYNSEEKRKIPKQQWMKEKMQEDYWERGTQSRKSKEQWFNLSVNTLMSRMKHNDSDLHVLQWRHGCEVEQQEDEVKFIKVDEYGYDGKDFLSYDIKESKWVAPVDAALLTKRKWDSKPKLNQNSKGYLETTCLDWLNKFRKYRDEKLRNTSPPDVHMFAKRYIKYKTRLKLTCMATGFYHKDVKMNIRKNNTSLHEDEVESTGVRPNHDGSFQMRKSVVIKEGDESADYDCLMYHRSFKEPVIYKWDGKCWDCSPETPAGAVIGFLIGAELVLAAFGFLVFKRINGRGSTGEISDVKATSSREDLYPLISAEKMASVKEQLLEILNELNGDNKKTFKWHLKEFKKVPASVLEITHNTEILDQMVSSFGLNKAMKVTVEILEKIKRIDLVEQLSQ